MDLEVPMNTTKSFGEKKAVNVLETIENIENNMLMVRSAVVYIVLLICSVVDLWIDKTINHLK